jgi:hypothetical protein
MTKSIKDFILLLIVMSFFKRFITKFFNVEISFSILNHKTSSLSKDLTRQFVIKV